MTANPPPKHLLTEVLSSDAPSLSTCPSSLITRTGSPLDGGQALTVEESAYLQHRHANVLPSLWAAYLSNSSTGVTGKISVRHSHT